jgi:hypothetical protein
MMPGDDELGAGAKAFAAIGHDFGGLDFHVDGAGAGLNGEIENTQLFFDAPVKTAMVLMAAAGGENRATRILAEELRDSAGAHSRIGQIVEAELEEVLAGLGFALGLLEQARDIGQPKRNTDLREARGAGSCLVQ